MKVAIVHDQLCEFGGAERVLVSLKKIFPTSDIYTSVYNEKTLKVHKNLVKNWKINTSWFNKIPIINKLYSPLRFITPLIWESFDFSKYDLVISSSGGYMSKGIKTKHPTIHISYIHHPPRYLYGYETMREWQKYLLIKIYGTIINHFLRLWDFESSQRPDYIIANSEETKKRIEKFYRRDSFVIYPPVSIPKKITPNSNLLSKNYYITVSRFARPKHIDILIKAANIHKFKLKIIGSGRDEKYLRSIAGNNVEFLINVQDTDLTNLLTNAKAFLFSSVDEEFGIAPVEAMGHMLPVIAYKSGGIPETVKDSYNGFLFDELTPESLIKKIIILESFENDKYLEMQKNARKTAESFSEEKFRGKILKFVRAKLNKYAY